MPFRPFILLLIGLAVASCPFRCLQHQANVAAHFARFSSETSPIDAVAPLSPVDAEDESGCICRGAFFVEAPAIVPLDLAHWLPFLQQHTPLAATFSLESAATYLQTDDFLLRPPLAGRALRALVGSFLF